MTELRDAFAEQTPKNAVFHGKLCCKCHVKPAEFSGRCGDCKREQRRVWERAHRKALALIRQEERDPHAIIARMKRARRKRQRQKAEAVHV